MRGDNSFVSQGRVVRVGFKKRPFKHMSLYSFPRGKYNLIMRPTKTLTGAKALKKIYQGVNSILVPVRATFGSEGKSALLYRTMNRGNRITDDGVTVAECQEPKDQFVRMVAQTFKEMCKRTVEKVGDGTTATTILGGTLFNELYKDLDETVNVFSQKSGKKSVISLKKEILAEAEKVKEAIKASAKKIETLEDLEKVAKISVKDEELGKIVAQVAWEVGVDGFVDVVEGYKEKIETEVIKGMRFSAKVPAKAFVNNPARFEMVATDCPILITNYNLDNAGELAEPLKSIGKKTAKLIIVAPQFHDNVLVNLVNAAKGGYFIYPVLAPSLRTEQLDDLSVYCGAKFIDKVKGNRLQNVKFEDLGFIEKIVVKDSEIKEDAIITGGAGAREVVNAKTKVEERIEILKSQLVETKQDTFKKLLERRIASMASAVGVIRVGDSTQASSLYRKLKIEDGVYACRAALRGGYVKGGGLCLKEIADTLPEGHILKTTLLAPYEQIQGSVEGGVEIKDDVIDPADAIYYAVEHATQVVANLITVDSITCELEDPLPEEGNYEIAKMLKELVIADKIHKGQIKEGQAEAYRDELGGLNEQEYMILNED